MTQTQHEPGGQGPRVPPEQMRDLRRLRRSITDRKVAGVAGGLARHLDIDPTIVRVTLAVLAFFGGAGLLIYLAGWLLIPEEGTDEAAIATSAETRSVALVVALVVGALLLVGNGWWFGGFGPGWPAPWGLLVVGLVLFAVLRTRGSRTPYTPAQPGQPPPAQTGGVWQGEQPTPAGEPGGAGPPPGSGPPSQPHWSVPLPPPHPPRPPRPTSLFGVTMAVVLLVLGLVAAVELAFVSLPWAVYPAAALAVVGVGLVVAAFVGRSGGLTFAGLLAGLVLAVAVVTPELRFGDIVERPTTAAELQDRYTYTAGRLRLDLTAIEDLEQLDGRELDLTMRAGQVIVWLPTGLDVEVDSRARGGQLVMLDHLVEGNAIHNTQRTPDTAAPDLWIDLDLGFGHANVSTP